MSVFIHLSFWTPKKQYQRSTDKKNTPFFVLEIQLRYCLSTCCQLLVTSWCNHPLVQTGDAPSLYLYYLYTSQIKTVEVSWLTSPKLKNHVKWFNATWFKLIILHLISTYTAYPCTVGSSQLHLDIPKPTSPGSPSSLISCKTFFSTFTHQAVAFTSATLIFRLPKNNHNSNAKNGHELICMIFMICMKSWY